MPRAHDKFNSNAFQLTDSQLYEKLNAVLRDDALAGIAIRNAAERVQDLLADVNVPFEVMELLGIIGQTGEAIAARTVISRDLAGTMEERAFAQYKQNMLLADAAYRDPLTGAYNRRYLTQALPEKMADAEKGRPVSVLALDIDHFKKVNDTYGHDAGDKVLQIFSGILQANVKKEDMVVRMGGEEFTVILAGMDAAGAQLVAERLRAAVDASPAHPATQTSPEVPHITVSIGAAQMEKGETFESAMVRADAALYEAKNGGRNRVAVARPSPAQKYVAANVSKPGPATP